jgi:hypothetical protein
MDTKVKDVPTVRAHDPAYQGYQILHWTFVAVPTIAGLDKFFHLLTNWDQYFAPSLERFLPLSVHVFFMLVGVVEIVAGLIVAVWPRIGAYVVAAWLAGIVIDLTLVGGVLDIAFRDFGLLLGAIALARLAVVYGRRGEPAKPAT